MTIDTGRTLVHHVPPFHHIRPDSAPRKVFTTDGHDHFLTADYSALERYTLVRATVIDAYLASFKPFVPKPVVPLRPGPWRTVLGFRPRARPSPADIDAAFKALARLHHPDVGGSHESMTILNHARERALSTHR